MLGVVCRALGYSTGPSGPGCFQPGTSGPAALLAVRGTVHAPFGAGICDRYLFLGECRAGRRGTVQGEPRDLRAGRSRMGDIEAIAAERGKRGP